MTQLEMQKASYLGLLNCHQKFIPCRATTATPTNSTRATPTHAMPLSMRRRSPSPVVTGNVSRARMRFESGGSVKNNKTSPSPVPSGFEISSKYNSLTGLEPLTSSQHQTLPRTFRFMNNNQNNTSSMDTIYRPDTKTTINKFLSGSSYANNMNTVIILIEFISNIIYVCTVFPRIVSAETVLFFIVVNVELFL